MSLQKQASPQKENKMGVMPVKRLIISMSLPMMASMLVQALYNIVDSIFVSQISEKRIKTPAEVLSVGDKVKVKVIGIKDGKISLSMKQAEEETPKPVHEEKVFDIPGSKEQATTSLASLFANIKLD